jgi:hypothetical protein
MTEAEWLALQKPEQLLDFFTDDLRSWLPGNLYPRKFRLFSVACCRLVAPPHIDPRSQNALDVAERDANGLAADGEIDQAWQSANEVGGNLFAECAAAATTPYLCLRTRISLGSFEEALAETSPYSVACVVMFAAASMFVYDVPLSPIQAKLQSAARFNRLIYDIFGNPFRPITLNPSWLTSTVTTLAQQMYDSSDFSAMPILADALQDAGCDNEQILNHCREPGVHVRGCFVVDLLLNKK